MGYTFRTDGPWGVGIGQDLTPIQVDTNFWQAIQDIAAKAPQGVGIAGFSVIGNLMTVVLTDHTLMGPYTLPVANLVFRGEWQPEFSYYTNSIITANGSTYIVLMNHMSAMTFDPGANDGEGNDYYGLLLQNPGMVVPDGGAVGAFLRKATTADWSMRWQTAALSLDLSDVVIASAISGDVLTYNTGRWRNIPGVSTLAGLSDVSIAAPTNGQTLMYEFGNWANVTPPVGPGISIQETSPLNLGEPLVFNGSFFTNSPKVDLPYGLHSSASGDITLDRSTGEVQNIILVGDTTLSFTGWPATNGQFARIVLAVANSASWVVTWPTILWAGGIIPNVSVNATDIFIFFSYDGGSNVYGNVVGQNYTSAPSGSI